MMLARLTRFVELNSLSILVLGGVALVLYVVARMFAARWPVALTFSTMPIFVFVFFTEKGNAILAGMF